MLDFLILFHRSWELFSLIFNPFGLCASVRIIATELSSNLLVTFVSMLKMLLIANELVILDMFFSSRINTLFYSVLFICWYFSIYSIILLFSSKSINIFLTSILKSLIANFNMTGSPIGLLLLIIFLLILSYKILLPIGPMIVWTLALLDRFYFALACSLGAALSSKAQSCSFSAKCEVFYQSPYLARLALKITLCTCWNADSAQFFSPDVTF